jgi:hypothetical protein
VHFLAPFDDGPGALVGLLPGMGGQAFQSPHRQVLRVLDWDFFWGFPALSSYATTRKPEKAK